MKVRQGENRIIANVRHVTTIARYLQNAFAWCSNMCHNPRTRSCPMKSYCLPPAIELVTQQYLGSAPGERREGAWRRITAGTCLYLFHVSTKFQSSFFISPSTHAATHSARTLPSSGHCLPRSHHAAVKKCVGSSPLFPYLFGCRHGRPDDTSYATTISSFLFTLSER